MSCSRHPNRVLIHYNIGQPNQDRCQFLNHWTMKKWNIFSVNEFSLETFKWQTSFNASSFAFANNVWIALTDVFFSISLSNILTTFNFKDFLIFWLPSITNANVVSFGSTAKMPRPKMPITNNMKTHFISNKLFKTDLNAVFWLYIHEKIISLQQTLLSLSLNWFQCFNGIVIMAFYFVLKLSDRSQCND